MAPKREIVLARQIIISRLDEIFVLSNEAISNDKVRILFKIKYRTVASLYEEFNDLHIKILVQSPDTELESQDNIRKQVEEQYFHICANFESLYPPVLDVPILDNQISQSEPNVCSNVNLPKLELRKFNGGLLSWQAFISLFDSLVHAQNHLSDIEKFHYLVLSLEDEPLTLVKSIPLSPGNYALAYKTLLERYSNKRLLATNHWHILKNYRPINSENLKELRRLVDTFSENLSILETLGFDVLAWDFIIVDLLLDKLPSSIRKSFELRGDASKIPVYADHKEFLLKQCVALETIANSRTVSGTSGTTLTVKPSQSIHSKRSSSSQHTNSLLVQTSSSSPSKSPIKCPICQNDHIVYRCSQLTAMMPRDRHAAVKRVRLCFNCLKDSHGVTSCSSQLSCLTCGKRHHTLLHFTESNSNNSNEVQQTQPSSSSSTNSAAVHAGTSVLYSQLGKTVLLSTVLFEILDVNGHPHVVRGLCYPGSMASFMTEACARRLQLSRTRSSVPILGLGQMSTKSSLGVSRCFIRPRGSSQQSLQLNVIILKTICTDLPSTTLSPAILTSFQPFSLADPTWHQSGPIDILLGADIYSSIVLPGVEKSLNNALVGIHTIFGVMLVGPVCHFNLSQAVQSFFAATDTPCSDQTLKKFWEVEQVPAKMTVSSDEEQAEIHFQKTHFRMSDGRFGVSLPFRTSEPIFKDSYVLARRRLISLERRFVTNSKLQAEYVEFMKYYLASEHMTLIDISQEKLDCFYIPHHCVFKMENETPKIRVVFDASAKDSSGCSLNDSLLVGPKLQRDIATILLRFRVYSFVFTCDVRQMYRQILVSEDHRRYQLILWRFSPSDPIQTYKLNTVTYGVSSAPFLAIRTMLQLAEEGRNLFPLAAEAIENNLYVDDLVCGANSIQSVLELQRQVQELFTVGRFELRKWSSNHPALIESIPENHRLGKNLSFVRDESNFTKVLGLQWQSSIDSFSFSIKPRSSNCTKRSILSEIASIYDPFGFLCPITLFAKRLIQILWTLGLGWDENPPQDIVTKWQHYKAQLSCIASLQIPRPIITHSNLVSCQLHAFCDASESGYACVAYLRCTYVGEDLKVSFLCAKSKEAPLKTLSIPRLELCAAVLLSSLVSWVKTTFQSLLSLDSIFAWSDSTIVLNWIKSSPHRWKPFVSNRVTYIQERLAPDCWYHVRSFEIPADCASRGFLPEEFVKFPPWWAGPVWLNLPAGEWPIENWTHASLPTDIDLEVKKTVLVAQVVPTLVESLCIRYSSLRKIQGIIAYSIRFLRNCQCTTKIVGPLSHLELYQSLMCIVKSVQEKFFSQEISALQKGKKLPNSFKRLSPFLDDKGILRVGGRLSQSALQFETKHPALLPSSHVISKLLIFQIHHQHLHSGVNTTQYLLEQNFWIMGARRLIRHCLSKCYRCFRSKPISVTCPMGDLPKFRVSEAKPFSHVGVDFGGPFSIVSKHYRGAKTSKAYLCLFICLSVKAVHLEITSELSTEAFLAALRRFIARRGRCSHIFSDCGTNFVGANRILQDYMKSAAEGENITWHFNPPSAPHFGGIWESGIKSVKTHLYRVVGTQILTFEELSTLVIQIEALLNSRPLCSISSDPNDLRSLTPGHFLTLEPLTAPPNPDLSHIPISRLSRWQLIQSMQQSFWSRWRDEYLHQLYQKGRWFKTCTFDKIDLDTLVLIKNELTPPLSWKLGRIVELHPGNDGICRVATVRTAQGVLRRPCVKLCPLPTQ